MSLTNDAAQASVEAVRQGDLVEVDGECGPFEVIRIDCVLARPNGEDTAETRELLTVEASACRRAALSPPAREKE